MKQYYLDGFLKALISKKKQLELRNKQVASENQRINRANIMMKVLSYSKGNSSQVRSLLSSELSSSNRQENSGSLSVKADLDNENEDQNHEFDEGIEEFLSEGERRDSQNVNLADDAV